MYSNANSVYEDDNIKLEIYNEALWASNKTTKTMFIAVDQSFLIHNGSARPLWDNSKKKTNSKQESIKESPIRQNTSKSNNNITVSNQEQSIHNEEEEESEKENIEETSKQILTFNNEDIPNPD